MLTASIFNVKVCDSVVFHVSWKTYWNRMFRQHAIDIVCFVENLLTSCVLWKTYWHRMFHQHDIDIVVSHVQWKTYWHRVYRGKLTDIVCTVENLLTSCVLWKTYWHRGLSCFVETYWNRVNCGKLTDVVCTVKNLLTSCLLWKNYWHRVYRGKLTDIVFTLENLLTSYVSWKTYWHRIFRGKLTDMWVFDYIIVRFVVCEFLTTSLCLVVCFRLCSLQYSVWSFRLCGFLIAWSLLLFHCKIIKNLDYKVFKNSWCELTNSSIVLSYSKNSGWLILPNGYSLTSGL